MESKEQLIKVIKEWLKNDNEIRMLKKEIAYRKTQNDNLSKILIDTMKIHEIDRFDINGGGKIVYTKHNVKKPINKQYLLDIITRFYDGDKEIGMELSDFIYQNREKSVKETITLRGGGAREAAAPAQDDENS